MTKEILQQIMASLQSNDPKEQIMASLQSNDPKELAHKIIFGNQDIKI